MNSKSYELDFNCKQIFKVRIKELRQEKNLTMQQLADRLYFSKNAISNWERGACLPNLERLISLAEFFNVTVGYLLGVENF
jgi:DNA-binding helix-turn-helix protein